MIPGNPPTQFHYPPVNRRLVQIGFYLTSIGSLHYPPNMPYPIAGHPKAYQFDWGKGRILHEYVLILIESGSGLFETSKVPLSTVNAGQYIWVVPGERHRYRPDLATGWTERWVGLNGFHLHQLRKSAIIPDSSTLLSHRAPSHRKSTALMMERLLKDVKAAPGSNKSSWSTRTLEILLHVFDEMPTPLEPSIPMPSGDPLVNQALSYIRENCHRELTVALVAAQCRTGRRLLERRFASTGGKSIAQEILSARVERAELLLKESQLPIKEIAYACGFANAQRMIYSFRNQFGCTPSSLRAGC